MTFQYRVIYDNKNKKEDFFVSYAVRGGINPYKALRADMPSLYPQQYPPYEPSPLSTRWRYIPKISYVGII
jgi:hypothetical protein